MKLLALPRDVNPYQEYLYRELGRLGVRVRYVGELTGSQTANLLLLPLELLTLRLRGWRLLHLHWVFGFSFPWAGRAGRWAAQLWFGLVLLTCRAIGLRIVWTAHNALPHDRVFADDLVARRWLVRASSLVIAHDARALEQLGRLGLEPRRAEVIAPGPFSPRLTREPSRAAGSGEPPWTLLFFGNVLPYKGVEDLLAAVAGLDPAIELRVVVAGACPDPQLRDRLRELAGAGHGRVDLRLARVPDAEVAALLASCDTVVLPYRERDHEQHRPPRPRARAPGPGSRSARVSGSGRRGDPALSADRGRPPRGADRVCRAVPRGTGASEPGRGSTGADAKLGVGRPSDVRGVQPALVKLPGRLCLFGSTLTSGFSGPL